MEEKATRKGSAPIKVYCLPEERALIQANAKKAAQSLSTYLLNVGMGYEIRGVLDHERVDDLARINGDLGRLGGLLKLWLTNSEKLKKFDQEQMRQTIAGVLAKIGENQDALKAVMTTVVRS